MKPTLSLIRVNSDRYPRVHPERTRGPRGPRRSRAARPRRAGRPRGGDAALLPRLRDERHRRAGAAGRPGRAQAGPPQDPLRHVRLRLPAGPGIREVLPGRRRRDGPVPPARRLGDLRRAGPDGAVLVAAVPAGRRQRQLRLARQRSGCRNALLHTGSMSGSVRPMGRSGSASSCPARRRAARPTSTSRSATATATWSAPPSSSTPASTPRCGCAPARGTS